MKNIELTDKHRAKLRIMCNNLYPETTLIKVNNKTLSFYSANKEGHIYKGDKAYLKMHWFEFCITHLSKAIFNKLNNFDHMMTADLEEEVSTEWDNELIMHVSFHVANPERKDNWHPIDYLYKQFKTLK